MKLFICALTVVLAIASVSWAAMAVPADYKLPVEKGCCCPFCDCDGQGICRCDCSGDGRDCSDCPLIDSERCSRKGGASCCGK